MMIIAVKEDEVNKVMEEMQTTIKEVEKSEYYRHMVQHLRNKKKFRNSFLRVLGKGKGKGNSCREHGPRLQMVMYGIGSIQTSYRSQYQLSLAILLSRDLSNWIEGTMEFFYPYITHVDVKVMEALGCKVLDKTYRYPVVTKPTLFFMPFILLEVLESLVLANLCGSRLSNIVLFTNSLLGGATTNLTINTISRHALKFNCDRDFKTALPFCKEINWPFQTQSWWFFNLSMFNANQLEAIWMKAGISWKHDDHMHGKEEECMDSLYLLDDEEEECMLSSHIWVDRRYPGSPAKRNWCPPSYGWIKLNFSAVAVATGYINYKLVLGYGGIFHNENKECLLSYSCPLPNEDAAGDEDLDFANAEALKNGLRLYMDLRSTTTLMDDRRKLVIEGDSVNIVRWVNGMFPPPKRLVGIVKQIRNLMSGIDDKHVVFHIYKEANSMAIDLANQGANKLLIKQTGRPLQVYI